MSKWLKRDNASSLKEVVIRNTGLSEKELLEPKKNYFIKGIDEAAKEIFNAILSNINITIYGDYDADGVTSSSIIYLLLSHLGAKHVKLRVPKRFSDGYGLSKKAVEEIESGLLITVDNGISAVDEIQFARDKGLRVVVLDHHLKRDDGVLPNANVIVDPSAIEGSEFEHYCAAGLAYKLSLRMSNDETFLKKVSTLAAIGTIADVMPLVKDNRNIVIEGLKNINTGDCNYGLKRMLEALSIYDCDEGKIGYKIGPIINACGRMYDNGASFACGLFISEDFALVNKYINFMIGTNEKRKEAVEEGMKICKTVIDDRCAHGENPLVVFTTKEDSANLHEGIVGILAGRLSEEYRRPVFVLTETEDGVLKGSGRSFGDLHLKELLDTVSSKLMKYGGHAGAAGLSVEKSMIEDFICDIQVSLQNVAKYTPDNQNFLYYDLEITSEKVSESMEELKKYAPFGEGNPKPIFLIRENRLLPKGGKFFRSMGDKGQHLKLFSNECDIVAFDMFEHYNNIGTPMCIDVVGTISENNFRGVSTLQIETLALEKSVVKRPSSSLADKIAEKMRNNGLN